MSEMRLFKALGEVEDRFILEADEERRIRLPEEETEGSAGKLRQAAPAGEKKADPGRGKIIRLRRTLMAVVPAAAILLLVSAGFIYLQGRGGNASQTADTANFAATMAPAEMAAETDSSDAGTFYDTWEEAPAMAEESAVAAAEQEAAEEEKVPAMASTVTASGSTGTGSGKGSDAFAEDDLGLPLVAGDSSAYAEYAVILYLTTDGTESSEDIERIYEQNPSLLQVDRYEDHHLYVFGLREEPSGEDLTTLKKQLEELPFVTGVSLMIR